jgi:hypothetical protein
LQLLILNVSNTQSTQNEIMSLAFFKSLKYVQIFLTCDLAFTVLHIKKNTQKQHVCMHPFVCTCAQFTESRVSIWQVCTHPKCQVTQTTKLYMMVPTICRSLLRTWFLVTFLVPRILRYAPELLKFVDSYYSASLITLLSTVVGTECPGRFRMSVQ